MTAGAAPPDPAAPTRGRIADEAERILRAHVLEKWFPAAIDPAGGFHQNFAPDWRRLEGGPRSVVFQARMTWTAAAASGEYPGETLFAEANRHGLAFLAARFWDERRGGFFFAAGPDGPGADGAKHAYGQAFAIFAASASPGAGALDLARDAFAWLDHHGRDPRHGGYFEQFSREGEPILRRRGRDEIGEAYGGKSLNAHLHLLEAFSALHRRWPDARLRARLAELLALLRAAAASGGLATSFRRNFRPRRRPLRALARSLARREAPSLRAGQSYGHNLEAACLMDEAAQALGEDAGADGTARALVDRALEEGWDEANGGFRHLGPPGADARKLWWVQVEALNALLLMHARHGEETSRHRDAFRRAWDFLLVRQLDARHGGLHPVLAPDGRPLDAPKGDGWTDPYHQTRALLNVMRTLRKADAQRPLP